MHLGNGAISAECVVLTAGAAGAGLAAAAAAVRREGPSRDRLLTAAGLGTLVFAAQAINVPIWPGVSAHLVGGALLAWVLRPALGSLTMALILALQALLLGDGGLAALGANVLNMAILPAALVAIVQRYSTSISSAGMAALASVPLAAAMIVVETSLFRTGSELAGWSSFAALMIGAHLGIGILEAGLTMGAIFAFAWLTRQTDARNVRALPLSTGCLAAAVLLVLFAWPFASAQPDGYEAAAERAGRAALLSEESAELARAGRFNAAAASVQDGVVTAARALLGTEQRCLIAATLLTAVLLVAAAACSGRETNVAPQQS